MSQSNQSINVLFYVHSQQDDIRQQEQTKEEEKKINLYITKLHLKQV